MAYNGLTLCERYSIIYNMNKNIEEKHANCEPIINWGRTNAHGLPALCCSTHRTIKRVNGRVVSSNLAWLDWISKGDLQLLIDSGVREITDEMANIIEQPDTKQFHTYINK